MSALRKMLPVPDAPDARPRRAFLSALAGAPAVALLPTRAVASPLDAAVVVKAAEVRHLMLESHAAGRRFDELEPVLKAAAAHELGPKPCYDRKAIANLCVKVLVAFGEVTDEVDAAVSARRRELEQRLAAEVEAWETAHEAIVDRLGVKAAEDRAAEAYRAMHAAMMDLAAMPVASLGGVAAKASVFKQPQPFCVENYAHQDFAVAILRDLGCEIEQNAD